MGADSYRHITDYFPTPSMLSQPKENPKRPQSYVLRWATPFRHGAVLEDIYGLWSRFQQLTARTFPFHLKSPFPLNASWFSRHGNTGYHCSLIFEYRLERGGRVKAGEVTETQTDSQALVLFSLPGVQGSRR